jgi:hypothetical protein
VRTKALLARQPGVVAKDQWVSALNPNLFVGMPVYESAEASQRVAAGPEMSAAETKAFFAWPPTHGCAVFRVVLSQRSQRSFAKARVLKAGSSPSASRFVRQPMKTALALTILVSSIAYAQETPAPTAAPSPVTASTGRLRWGLSGNGGWHFPQPALSLGTEGRIGYQISSMFGAYATLGGLFGFGFGGSASATGGTASVTAFSRWYIGAIAELFLSDLFFVGAGPVFANGGFAGVTASANPDGVGGAVFAHAGPAFGLDVRLGLQLGRQPDGPGTRKSGFSLGLSAMTLFHPNTAVVRTQAGMGGGRVDVSTTELMVTVTPMLMLGYDWR